MFYFARKAKKFRASGMQSDEKVETDKMRIL